jgi:hypothetical protein
MTQLIVFCKNVYVYMQANAYVVKDNYKTSTNICLQLDETTDMA